MLCVRPAWPFLRGPAPVRAADITNISCYLLEFLFGYFISPLHLGEETCAYKRSLLGHTLVARLDATMVVTFFLSSCFILRSSGGTLSHSPFCIGFCVTMCLVCVFYDVLRFGKEWVRI